MPDTTCFLPLDSQEVMSDFKILEQSDLGLLERGPVASLGCSCFGTNEVVVYPSVTFKASKKIRVLYPTLLMVRMKHHTG